MRPVPAETLKSSSSSSSSSSAPGAAAAAASTGFGRSSALRCLRFFFMPPFSFNAPPPRFTLA
jgi:hypothetical protein